MSDKLAYSIPEFARAVDLSERSVYNLIERGELPTVSLLGKQRITKQDADVFIERLRADAGLPAAHISAHISAHNGGQNGA